MSFSRRSFLTLGGAAGALAAFPTFAWGAQTGPEARKLAVVILRGGLDGLQAVPAIGDPNWTAARKALAEPLPQIGDYLPINETFALDARLANLAALFKSGEALAVHAACSPYQRRSHFDGQNVLESGGVEPFGLNDGWINRALAAKWPQAERPLGIGIAPQIPLALRGPGNVTSWAPSRLPAPDEDFLRRLGNLYAATDRDLAAALKMAEEANDIAAGMDGMEGGGGGRRFEPLARAAAQFLTDPKGPQAAVLELSGFDSHTAQMTPAAGLGRSMRELDAGLAAFKDGMGAQWANTLVLVVTEFGRTVAPNGSGGTDHGTGGVAFVLGGAVKGGRVLADWPGLAPANLLDGRDLRPTTDLRSVLKGALAAHWGLSPEALDRVVFPDSAKAAPMMGLLKA